MSFFGECDHAFLLPSSPLPAPKGGFISSFPLPSPLEDLTLKLELYLILTTLHKSISFIFKDIHQQILSLARC